MLFMGEEWASSSPFQFFTSHPEPELARATAEGRKAEFAAARLGCRRDPRSAGPRDLPAFQAGLGRGRHRRPRAAPRAVPRPDRACATTNRTWPTRGSTTCASTSTRSSAGSCCTAGASPSRATSAKARSRCLRRVTSFWRRRIPWSANQQCCKVIRSRFCVLSSSHPQRRRLWMTRCLRRAVRRRCGDDSSPDPTRRQRNRPHLLRRRPTAALACTDARARLRRTTAALRLRRARSSAAQGPDRRRVGVRPSRRAIDGPDVGD